MSDFLHRIGWRKELAAALPHARRSPHAFAPVDVALGFMAGVWCGADKFSRVRASGRRSAFARGARHRGAAEPADLDPLFSAAASQRSNTAGGGRLSRWLCGRLHARGAGTPRDPPAPARGRAPRGRRQTPARSARLPLSRRWSLPLPRSWSPWAVWRRYNGRAEIENRIKELAGQFGLKSFCCRKFWATEAACQLAIAACNLCVLFQRHLGPTQKVERQTLRFRLFSRAAVFSCAQGRPTLKFAIAPPHRARWRCLLEKLQSPLPPWNCNSVASLAA